MLLGVRVATLGRTAAADDEFAEVAFADGTDRYAKLLLDPSGGTVVGGPVEGPADGPPPVSLPGGATTNSDLFEEITVQPSGTVPTLKPAG